MRFNKTAVALIAVFFLTRYNILMNDKGKTAFGIIFVIALFAGALLFANNIQDNEQVKEIISSFGPFGILVVAFVSGLNLFVPVPATAFIPVFSAAGFSLSIIVIILVVGTTLADFVSFYMGTILKPHADKSNAKVLQFVRKYCKNRPRMTQAIVFLWAALVPFPNELLLLPLGTLGVKLRTLIIAFVLGTVVHVTALAYGLTSLI